MRGRGVRAQSADKGGEGVGYCGDGDNKVGVYGLG